MKYEIVERNGAEIAVVSGNEIVISDVASALDLMMTVRHEAVCSRIAVEKDCVAEPFFILSTQIAGEILQKFINYQMKLAVYGDYSKYTSKPLRDFIYESNKGKDFFFVSTRDEALERLSHI